MRIHANAKTTVVTRRLLCDRVRRQGWTVADAAAALSISERTAYRWLARDAAGDARQFSRFIIIMRERLKIGGNLGIGMGGGDARLRDARRAIEYHGRGNLGFFQQQFGLQQG